MELVDMLVSGTSDRKVVGVRVSPTAPDLKSYNQQIILYIIDLVGFFPRKHFPSKYFY